jgi:hypothetical protein
MTLEFKLTNFHITVLTKIQEYKKTFPCKSKHRTITSGPLLSKPINHIWVLLFLWLCCMPSSYYFTTPYLINLYLSSSWKFQNMCCIGSGSWKEQKSSSSPLSQTHGIIASEWAARIYSDLLATLWLSVFKSLRIQSQVMETVKIPHYW